MNYSSPVKPSSIQYLSSPLQSPSTYKTDLEQGQKRKGNFKQNGKLKCRRIVPISENATASCADRPNELEDAIGDHCATRVQSAFLTACTVYGAACTSKKPLKRLQLFAGGADTQIGRGHDGWDAAHIEVINGLQDNVHDLLKDRVVKKGLSPFTAKQLVSKGFSNKDLKLIKLNHKDFDLVDKIFKKNWSNSSRSVISGSKNELQITAATTQLPLIYNRVVDKGLENVLKKALTVFAISLYRGEILPDYYTQLFYHAARGHFRNVTAHLKQKIDDLKDYQNLLARLIEIKTLRKNDAGLKKSERYELRIKHVEISNQIKELEVKLKKRKPGVPRAKFKNDFTTFEELEQKNLKCDAKKGKKPPKLAPPDPNILIKETEKEILRFKEILKYSVYARKGIGQPNFKTLYDLSGLDINKINTNAHEVFMEFGLQLRQKEKPQPIKLLSPEKGMNQEEGIIGNQPAEIEEAQENDTIEFPPLDFSDEKDIGSGKLSKKTRNQPKKLFSSDEGEHQEEKDRLRKQSAEIDAITDAGIDLPSSNTCDKGTMVLDQSAISDDFIILSEEEEEEETSISPANIRSDEHEVLSQFTTHEEEEFDRVLVLSDAEMASDEDERGI